MRAARPADCTPLRLTLPTPLHDLPVLSQRWGISLQIKRDDLIPQALGGNKVRKGAAILAASMARDGPPELIVTAGGARSNHARAMALLGRQIGAEVHLVLHGAPETIPQGNAAVISAAGASVTHVPAEQIGVTLDRIVQAARGRRVLLVPGGGHSPDGAEAYATAVAELPRAPDVILHASGTGGTQAGLILGIARAGWATRVIGISVARDAARGGAAVRALLPESLHDRVWFDDRFRCGGYEARTPELTRFLGDVLASEGLALDPTYPGKAFLSLPSLISHKEIALGADVVFWNTGGLFTLRGDCT